MLLQDYIPETTPNKSRAAIRPGPHRAGPVWANTTVSPVVLVPLLWASVFLASSPATRGTGESERDREGDVNVACVNVGLLCELLVKGGAVGGQG